MFAEQGTGKTLPTLKRIAEGLKEGDFERALVVAPKAAMGAWERDQKFFTLEDKKLFLDRLTVINYDMVWRDSRFLKPFGCIVLDESHFIKNRTSRRGKHMLKMALNATHRYILTGTPINNGKLHEYWAQMAFLSPVKGKRTIDSEWLGSYAKFQEKYCLLDRYFQPYAYKHVSEIQGIVQDHSYRILKKDCLDLPEKLPDEIYDIELSPVPKKYYKQLMKSSAIIDLGIVAENPLTKLLRLRQLASGYIVDDFGKTHYFPSEKETVLKEFLEGWEKKLVIFCEFRESIDSVCRTLREKGIEFVTQDGRQQDNNIWQRFQNEPKIQIIVCQYQSASTSIDLFAADTILYYEPTISTNLLEQSRDRIHRIGQGQPCSYIHFLTKGSVEPIIYGRLEKFSDFNQRQFVEYMEEYTRVWRGK